ncbi:MAG TPA: glycosyltransferase family A protein [Luteitalea sp.]|nr:glycosyltransferase family A protein [Luteitalea sp.]
MIADVTVVMPARNAGATIGRAIRSVGGRRVREMVVVDHASSDDTAAAAVAAAADVPIRVIPVAATLRLGGVRQVGLDNVRTPYAVWLDADDELLEGRVDRFAAHLDAGADITADAAELQDLDGSRRPLPMPGFLQVTGGIVRLFERSYLPAPGVVGCRVEAVRRVGYDPVQHGPEDTDLLLRAIVAGLRFTLEPTPGYRIYASPGSISRQRANQRAMYRALLLKHPHDVVREVYLAAGWSDRVAHWAIHSMALFTDDLAGARRILDGLDGLSDGVTDDDVIERDGPIRHREGWRMAFARGTLALLDDQADDARPWLERAELHEPTAEGANNLGVALARAGRIDDARRAFGLAVERRPAYVDARDNLAAEFPQHVTTHPFRAQDVRLDYSAQPHQGPGHPIASFVS